MQTKHSRRLNEIAVMSDNSILMVGQYTELKDPDNSFDNEHYSVVYKLDANGNSLWRTCWKEKEKFNPYGCNGVVITAETLYAGGSQGAKWLQIALREVLG